MVTLAGLEPATSPVPGEQGRSIPLELQRRHDLHDRLWRRRGGGIGSTPTITEQGDARRPPFDRTRHELRKPRIVAVGRRATYYLSTLIKRTVVAPQSSQV
jgi:hypothetical protein